MNAYREKSKGLKKYYSNFQYTDKYLSKENIEMMNNIINKDINYIDDIIDSIEAMIDKDKLALLIKTEQDIHAKLIHNNNMILNSLADRYLKSDHDPEEVLETNTIIQESNNNNEQINYNNSEIKTVYKDYSGLNNIDIRKLYLFQISEIEKAIAEIEGKSEKTRKDINELYQYHNEILKIKAALDQM